MKNITKNDIIGFIGLALLIGVIALLVYAQYKGTLSNLNTFGY